MTEGLEQKVGSSAVAWIIFGERPEERIPTLPAGDKTYVAFPWGGAVQFRSVPTTQANDRTIFVVLTGQGNYSVGLQRNEGETPVPLARLNVHDQTYFVRNQSALRELTAAARELAQAPYAP